MRYTSTVSYYQQRWKSGNTTKDRNLLEERRLGSGDQLYALHVHTLVGVVLNKVGRWKNSKTFRHGRVLDRLQRYREGTHFLGLDRSTDGFSMSRSTLHKQHESDNYTSLFPRYTFINQLWGQYVDWLLSRSGLWELLYTMRKRSLTVQLGAPPPPTPICRHFCTGRKFCTCKNCLFRLQDLPLQNTATSWGRITWRSQHFCASYGPSLKLWLPFFSCCRRMKINPFVYCLLCSALRSLRSVVWGQRVRSL